MFDFTHSLRTFYSQPIRVGTFFVAFFICLAVVQTASAAAFVVNTTADTGAGSLRAAVTAANTNLQADTITFNISTGSTGCTGLICTITLTSGQLTILSDASNMLTIDGTGPNRVSISGNNASRVFYISPSANLSVINLTVTGGNGIGTTAPVFNNNGGGFLNNGGTLNLNGVTLTGNMVTNLGGGIYTSGGTTTFTNSTVSGNTSQFGGGISNNNSASLFLINSTVTNNSASDTTGQATGGVRNAADSTLTIKNTIVAGNNQNVNPDVFGAFTSQGYNLIGNTTGGTGFSAALNDILNPVGGAMLDALAYNGGQTDTHALLAGSPAIDKGNSSGIATDQRGSNRPVDFPSIPNAGDGMGADIGAFELQTAPSAASVTVSGRVLTQQGRGIRNVLVRLVDEQGQQRAAMTSTFGYFRFVDIPAGQTYTISVSGKKYSFTQPVQLLNLTGETDEINFVADN
jgi:hypothetical protein